MSTTTPPKTVAAPKRGIDTKALVPTNLQEAAARVADTRKAMIAANREVANATWSDKSLSPEERERFTSVCRSLGLNNALGHAEILGGKFYVTHKGLLHLLNADGRMWRIEGTSVAPGEPDHEFWADHEDDKVWRTTITLWHADKPDQVWSYTDFGVASIAKFSGKQMSAPQMAKKRAEHRAIRAVLTIDIPSADEMLEETFVTAAFTSAANASVKVLGEIPLEPKPQALESKPQAAPATAAKPTIERPAVEQVLERATEAEIRIEHVFAQAAKLSGKKVESTRDLATLDDATLTTLANEIAAFGPEPEATR